MKKKLKRIKEEMVFSEHKKQRLKIEARNQVVQEMISHTKKDIVILKKAGAKDSVKEFELRIGFLKTYLKPPTP